MRLLGNLSKHFHNMATAAIIYQKDRKQQINNLLLRAKNDKSLSCQGQWTARPLLTFYKNLQIKHYFSHSLPQITTICKTNTTPISCNLSTINKAKHNFSHKISATTNTTLRLTLYHEQQQTRICKPNTTTFPYNLSTITTTTKCKSKHYLRFLQSIIINFIQCHQKQTRICNPNTTTSFAIYQQQIQIKTQLFSQSIN